MIDYKFLREDEIDGEITYYLFCTCGAVLESHDAEELTESDWESVCGCACCPDCIDEWRARTRP